MSDGGSNFDGVPEGGKYGAANTGGLDTVSSTVTPSGGNNMDLNAANQNSCLDAYSPKSNTQSSISSALSQSVSGFDVFFYFNYLK